MTMGIEGNGANALAMGYRLVDVPEIKGGIGRDMDGELVQGQHTAQKERKIVGDIGFIEG